jgi:ATP-dependent DNA helicase RecG
MNGNSIMSFGHLPINLNDLLAHGTVESDRIEYKAGWNPDAIVRTLCAFANDFENLGGGYIIIGLEAKDGRPILPPVGVSDSQLDKIQRELLQYSNLIQPPYFPSASIEKYQGKNLVVLWAPGGQNRAYKAPKEATSKHKDYRYYIRRYSNTAEAKDGDLPELISLTATIPFDDRMCHKADLKDLKRPLIREYLQEVKSELFKDAAEMPMNDLGRQMNIVDGGDEYLKPRNCGVLFFNEAPDKFLPGTQIDVVIFPEGEAGDEIIEKIFKGPVHQQIRDALRYIKNNVIVEKVSKVPDRAEAERVFNFPYAAIEESIVNAMYHRSYELREPVEVRVNPDGMVILSFPGPDPSIKIETLKQERFLTRRYRNRRIGEFLKELKLTEGRCTGIPKIRKAMKQNGSPEPIFSTDEERTHFLVELPIHPSLKKAPVEAPVRALVEAPVKLNDAEQRILSLCLIEPRSKKEIIQGLGYSSMSGNLKKALQRLDDLQLTELTIPDKPNSKNQKRKLTTKGRQVAANLSEQST